MSTPVRLLPMGERAVLVELDSLAAMLALHARLAASRLDGVVDLVPAARTVLVPFDPRAVPASAVRAWIERVAGDPATDAAPPPDAPATVVLGLRYDGADLAETAALLGLAADELVRRHLGTEWSVAFTGFAPGFGYLVSAEWPFDVPRLAVPRPRVPAGAVGLAGEFAGVYPRESPGGWRLIGTSTTRLFDPAAERPALLAPGTRVRFREVS